MKKVFAVLLLTINVFSFADKMPDLGDIINFDAGEYLNQNQLGGADSKELNTIGFQEYQKGELMDAARLWYCAAVLDDTNAWAHYNLACVLSLFAARAGRDPAEIYYVLEYGNPETDLLFEYLDKIFYHLRYAIYFESKILARMQKDPDLDLIRNMDEYKFLLLYPRNDPAKLLGIVSEWYGSNHGAYPGEQVSIEGNRISITRTVFNEQDKPYTDTESGYFTLEGTHLTIHIQLPKERIIDGKLEIRYDNMGFILGFNLEIDGIHLSSTPDFSA